MKQRMRELNGKLVMVILGFVLCMMFSSCEKTYYCHTTLNSDGNNVEYNSTVESKTNPSQTERNGSTTKIVDCTKNPDKVKRADLGPRF